MQKLTLKNYFLAGNPELDIKSLQDWLFVMNLGGRQSRLRNRFLLLLMPRIKELDDERMKLAEQFSEKDKEGKVIYLQNLPNKKGAPTAKQIETTDKSKANAFKIKNFDGYNKAYINYLNEDLILDVSPETEETINGVKDIILTTDEKFFGVKAKRYDEICESFEGIK